MNSITQDMKYRQSLLTYAQKYGVSRAGRKYNKSRSYIYFWRTFQKEMPRDQWLVDLIVGCQQQCNPAYGIRRVHH